MFQAVLFDMDGLMFDTERLAKQAWTEVCAQFGVEIGETVLSRIRGATPEASAAVFREVYGAEFPYYEARAARKAWVENFIAKEGVPVKQGLLTLLIHLQNAGIRAAVVSSSAEATIRRYLEMSSLNSFFEVVIGEEHLGRSKPAPDGYLSAARLLHTQPSDCLILEDSANGLLAAKNAGITAVCIPDIAPPEEKALQTAAAVLNSLDDVWEWMKQI